ncbi:hypothetical protein SAMD00020551_0471 [Mesobacillus selenatarsenatis SF-1]|uniref:Uncharacterized protein n=1 Tax=Mesobacillus selenatarsenatis (strain DSM 18680 / JCM 14380 / FERM P-15431 / SF-1) TaxID=1321606 RepID=A0A0A8WZE7_MESS1|nr:hypothetical protein SAMD00020551_0471 [Mesobacillus selenatarsenatis SF-1]
MKEICKKSIFHVVMCGFLSKKPLKVSIFAETDFLLRNNDLYDLFKNKKKEAKGFSKPRTMPRTF